MRPVGWGGFRDGNAGLAGLHLPFIPCLLSVLVNFSFSYNTLFLSSVGFVLPACRRLLFPLLHAEKGRLRNAVANRVPASRWQGILFRINCEIISG